MDSRFLPPPIRLGLLCAILLFMIAGVVSGAEENSLPRITWADSLQELDEKALIEAAVARALFLSLESRTPDIDSVRAHILSFQWDEESFAPGVRLHMELEVQGPHGSLPLMVEVLEDNRMDASRKLTSTLVELLRYDGYAAVGGPPDALHLSYVWKNSLSVVDNEQALTPGAAYSVVDSHGDIQASVRAGQTYGGGEDPAVVELEPYWRNNPQPGMRIEKDSPWYLLLEGNISTFRVQGSIRPTGGARLTAGFSLPWKLMTTNISLGFFKMPVSLDHVMIYDVSIGLGLDIPLGNRLMSSWTFFRNGALSARIGIGGGVISSGGPVLTAYWDVAYRHQAAAHWAWSVGAGMHISLYSDAGRQHAPRVIAFKPMLVYLF